MSWIITDGKWILIAIGIVALIGGGLFLGNGGADLLIHVFNSDKVLNVVDDREYHFVEADGISIFDLTRTMKNELHERYPHIEEIAGKGDQYLFDLVNAAEAEVKALFENTKFSFNDGSVTITSFPQASGTITGTYVCNELKPKDSYSNDTDIETKCTFENIATEDNFADNKIIFFDEDEKGEKLTFTYYIGSVPIEVVWQYGELKF